MSSSNQVQDNNGTYIYAASNDYIEDQFYEPVAKPSAKVRKYNFTYNLLLFSTAGICLLSLIICLRTYVVIAMYYNGKNSFLYFSVS